MGLAVDTITHHHHHGRRPRLCRRPREMVVDIEGIEAAGETGMAPTQDHLCQTLNIYLPL